MNSPDEFDRMVAKEFPDEFQQETIDPTPYGGPAHPVKPGLTKRGKAAIAIGSAVLAAGALIGYQALSSSFAEDNAKAQEIALQQERIQLDKLKEMNRANNTQTAQNKNRQDAINKCVKDNKDLIGNDFNSSYRDIVDACQAQYTPTTSADGMQNIASTDAADTNHNGGSINGLLIGGGALSLVLVYAFKRNTQSN